MTEYPSTKRQSVAGRYPLAFQEAAKDSRVAPVAIVGGVYGFLITIRKGGEERTHKPKEKECDYRCAV
ncbi:MAG: hypothetical protein ACR2JC_09285 [Chloroflexota bacterium]